MFQQSANWYNFKAESADSAWALKAVTICVLCKYYRGVLLGDLQVSLGWVCHFTLVKLGLISAPPSGVFNESEVTSL